jgi:hypothetical protein
VGRTGGAEVSLDLELAHAQDELQQRTAYVDGLLHP